MINEFALFVENVTAGVVELPVAFDSWSNGVVVSTPSYV